MIFQAPCRSQMHQLDELVSSLCVKLWRGGCCTPQCRFWGVRNLKPTWLLAVLWSKRVKVGSGAHGQLLTQMPSTQHEWEYHHACFQHLLPHVSHIYLTNDNPSRAKTQGPGTSNHPRATWTIILHGKEKLTARTLHMLKKNMISPNHRRTQQI